MLGVLSFVEDLDLSVSTACATYATLWWSADKISKSCISATSFLFQNLKTKISHIFQNIDYSRKYSFFRTKTIHEILFFQNLNKTKLPSTTALHGIKVPKSSWKYDYQSALHTFCNYNVYLLVI